MLEFEPYSLEQFLTSLKGLKTPLVKDKWLVSKLWILQFYDGRVREQAILIWNKFGFSVKDLFSKTGRQEDSLVHYLHSDDMSTFENCSSAIVSSLELYDEQSANLIDELKEFYWIERTFVDNDEYTFKDNWKVVAKILKGTSHLIQEN